MIQVCLTLSVVLWPRLRRSVIDNADDDVVVGVRVVVLLVLLIGYVFQLASPAS